MKILEEGAKSVLWDRQCAMIEASQRPGEENERGHSE